MNNETMINISKDTEDNTKFIKININYNKCLVVSFDMPEILYISFQITNIENSMLIFSRTYFLEQGCTHIFLEVPFREATKYLLEILTDNRKIIYSNPVLLNKEKLMILQLN